MKNGSFTSLGLLIVLLFSSFSTFMSFAPPFYDNDRNASVKVNIDKTVVIKPEEWEPEPVDLEKGDTIFIGFQVLGDVPIDLFVMNESNFRNYEDGETFYSYVEPRVLEATSVESNKFEAPVDGKYYIVFDNTSKERGNASPDGNSVEVHYTINSGGWGCLWWFIGGIGLGLIICLGIWKYKA